MPKGVSPTNKIRGLQTTFHSNSEKLIDQIMEILDSIVEGGLKKEFTIQKEFNLYRED